MVNNRFSPLDKRMGPVATAPGSDTMSDLVAIGLRAKTGRAIVVVLGGAPESPIVLVKTEITLIDPQLPATAQPYHRVMDLPWPQWQEAAGNSARAIERVATNALAKLISEQAGHTRRVAGAGIVGAPDRDLARIGNPHIRAHAAEGLLFRRVLEAGAESNRLKWQSFPDREFDKSISAQRTDHLKIKQRLENLRRSVSAPWRTDENQAAMAAWIVLHG